MVLVASGPHGSGNASGSIGADTYSHNRFGQYVRNRTKPVNPNTPRQVLMRAALAELTVRWSQTLTAGQRTAWNLYASSVVMKNKIGEDTLLTGFNHYLRSNTSLIHFGGAPVDAGPTVFELPAHDPAYAIAISEATQQITVTYDDTMDWNDENGGRLLGFQGSPQNPQRNFFGGPWRWHGNLAGVNGAPPASPQILGTSFVCTAGQRVWTYGRISRADGRLSTPFQTDIIVGA